MFTNIVVGSDGSQAALAAVRKAGEVALSSGHAEVHVVVGHQPLSGAEIDRITRSLPDEFKDTITADSRGTEIADEAAAMLRIMGVEVHEHVHSSAGATAILDVADEVGADLVVVGSRGLGAGKRMLRGSVSTKVAANAPCSVLVVHQTDD